MNTAERAEEIDRVIAEKRPLVIAGPCSAETEEQVVQTAIQLKETGIVDILRAGIWKPRTRPGKFEGVGSIGLPWMQQARAETGLLYAIEVATAGQVEEALRHEADVLWIGARTTVNPFSVQEVADALKGVRIPVWIKNPVNADIELWVGALERVQKVGIGTIGLIHRGFSSYGDKEYRNAPMWHLAIEMKRRYPDLPFIVDPSHICGRRDTIPGVVQKAIDLDYDGVIIEAHCNPAKAWSDAKQQVTPQSLKEILTSVIWRKETVPSDKVQEGIERFRQQINQLDDELLQLVGKRMKIAEEIGAYKRANGITILQTGRWNEMLERLSRHGAEMGLCKEFVKSYFDAIHMESIRHQEEVMKK